MINLPSFKKPKYIRKYDYLRSFYQPKSEWFFDIKEMSDYIHSLTIEAIKKNNSKQLIVEDEDDAEEPDSEIDAYEIYRVINEDKKKEEIDDPKFIEGRIIDQIAKEFIAKKFSECKVVDFDLDKSNIEVQAKKTIELINSSENLVLFQPVFIYRDVIAKPDALVINNNLITLIETKGTSMTKINHIFDLYYQSQIVNGVLNNFNKQVDHFQLCVLKYDLAKIKQTHFVLIDKASFSKGSMTLPKSYRDNLQFKNKFGSFTIDVKARLRESNLSESYEDSDFDNIIYNHPSLLIKNGKKSKPRSFDQLLPELNDSNFWRRIKELKDHNPDVNRLYFIPHSEYKSFVKNNDYWLELRDYFYFTHKYLAASFSGNLISYSQVVMLNKYSDEINNIDTLYSTIKSIDKVSGRFNTYYTYINAHSSDYINNGVWSFKPNKIKQLFNKLKLKKVYFDFESLNLGLRVVDDTPPFMQTVNQVSIVMDHGDKKLQVKPYVVIDPLKGSNGKKFSKQDYKIIIDSLLPSKNLKECGQYSYVVFNKNFEKTRLEEMSQYINEVEYTEKVNIINNNIYDLADLFIISSNNKDANSKDKPSESKPFIVFKELHGYFSIKKVLPLVNKYDQEDFIKIGCKDYKLELQEIHNGVEAQTASAKRFFGLLSDEQWEKTKHNLGLYCNNDVLAMVAIEYFVDKILNNKINLK